MKHHNRTRWTAIVAAAVFCLAAMIPLTGLAGPGPVAAAARGHASEPQASASQVPALAAQAPQRAEVRSSAGVYDGPELIADSTLKAYTDDGVFAGYVGQPVELGVAWEGGEGPDGTYSYVWSSKDAGAPSLSAVADEPDKPDEGGDGDDSGDDPAGDGEGGSGDAGNDDTGDGGSERTGSASGPDTPRVVAVPTENGQWTWTVGAIAPGDEEPFTKTDVTLTVAQPVLSVAYSPADAVVALGTELTATPTVTGLGAGSYQVTIYAGSEGGTAVDTGALEVTAAGERTSGEPLTLPTDTALTTEYLAVVRAEGSTVTLASAPVKTVTVAPAQLQAVDSPVSILTSASPGQTTLAVKWSQEKGNLPPAWPNIVYAWSLPPGAPGIANSQLDGGRYITTRPSVTLDNNSAPLEANSYTYRVQAMRQEGENTPRIPIGDPVEIVLTIYEGPTLAPVSNPVTIGIGEKATLAVEWVAGTKPTGISSTVVWKPQAGAPALVGAGADGTLETAALSVQTIPATAAGPYTYTVVPLSADGEEQEDMAATITLIVASPQTGQPTATSATLPYPGSLHTVAGDRTSIVAGQTGSLPSLLISASPESAQVAWYGPFEDGPELPEDLELDTKIGEGSELQLESTEMLAAAQPGDELYYYAVVTNEVAGTELKLTVPYTVSVLAPGEQALVVTTSNAPVGTELPVVVGSGNPTWLSLVWMPDLEPAGASYTWTVSRAPEGGTFNVSASQMTPGVGCTENLAGTGLYTVHSGSSWTTPRGVLQVSTANFTVAGRYEVTYAATTATGSREGTRTGTIPIVVGEMTVPTISGSYTYSIAKGYFPGTGTSPIILQSDYPKNVVTTAGGGSDASTLNPLTIGPNGYTADGTQTALNLNDRVELYYNPENISLALGGTPTRLSNEPGSASYWQNWVGMTWRCRPSQQGIAGGNALTIPGGQGYSGVNSPLLVITPLTADMEGWEFSLEIHVLGSVNLQTTTPWVHLDIDGVAPGTIPTPTISSYPAGTGSRVSVPAGGQVSFITGVQSSIAPENLSYQWESMVPATADDPYPSWQVISGATDAVLTFNNVSSSQNNMQYRCRVINTGYAAGATAYTSAMTLTVRDQNGSIVFAEPIESSLINLYAGRSLTTSVSARTDNGDAVAYQWYVRYHAGAVPGGQDGMLRGEPITTVGAAATYLASTSAMQVSGATGPSMTTAALEEGVYEFACRVMNQSNASMALQSEPVYVVVTQESRRPLVTPTAAYTNVGVVNGQSIDMPASGWVASGEQLTYQWQTTQTPASSSSWANLTGTSDTLTLAGVTATYGGSYYRCLVGNPAAGVGRYSGMYHLNVWNTAHIPAIIEHPVNAVGVSMNGLPEVTVPNGPTYYGIQLTSSASVAQPDTLGMPLTARWYREGDTDPLLDGDADPYGNRFIVTQLQLPDQRQVSYLTITGMAGNANAARAACGSYYCVWYKAQQDTNVMAPQPYISTRPDVVLAPQAVSESAEVSIDVPGDPVIAAVTGAMQQVPVGGQASFRVSAHLNSSAASQPQGSLVYTWQITEDGGATWRNCLSSDGSGQFTSAFTTRPLTQTMYNNSTASNVRGTYGNPEYGAPGNSRTVYMYRCIVANRTTGARIHTGDLQLVIGSGTEAPPSQSPSPSPSPSQPTQSPSPSPSPGGTPAINPGTSSIVLSGSGSSRYVTGPQVTRTGYDLEAYLRLFNQQLPSGYTYVIVDTDGYALNSNDVVATGMTLRLMSQASGEAVEQATIIIPGDVRGTGVLNITQLVAIADDIAGNRKLTGPYAMAADMNHTGRVDIGDLVIEARLFT